MDDIEIINSWLQKLALTDDVSCVHIIDIDFQNVTELLISLRSYYKQKLLEGMPQDKKHDDWFAHTGIKEDREHYCCGFNSALSQFKQIVEVTFGGEK